MMTGIRPTSAIQPATHAWCHAIPEARTQSDFPEDLRFYQWQGFAGMAPKHGIMGGASAGATVNLISGN